MGGLKKYLTEEERKAALRENRKRFEKTHPDRIKANSLVQDYRREDKKYGRGECTITKQWIMDNIFTSKCHYCGVTGWENLGCDSINNDLPHTPDNVVPCCHSCNKKRGKMPYKEFVTKCESGEEIKLFKYAPHSKPVVAKDPITLKVVYEFISAAEAGRNGFDEENVGAACRGCYMRDGNHKYKGLLWYYKGDV